MRLRQFSRELWYLQRPWAVTILACVLVSGVLAFVAIPVQWAKWQRALEAESAALQALQRVSDAVPEAPPPGADFPPAAHVAQVLEHLASAGQRERLRVGEITARPVPMASGALQRHEVSLTVTGPFPETRALIADLLDKYPFLALDSILVTRPAPDTPVVETQLRLSVYTRP